MHSLMLFTLWTYCFLVGTQPTVVAANNHRPLTWAVIVSSSRFWLNYRHTTNALAIYNSIKRLGVQDNRIVLMLADSMACDPRNPLPGEIYSHHLDHLHKNLYGKPPFQVDYCGRDVGVRSVLDVLTGNHPPGTLPSRRMDSDANATVFIYLTGHGGDGFLKFHDQDELLSADIAAAVQYMHAAHRYRELFLFIDTCQAATLYNRLSHMPRWAAVSSSTLGQSSYALRNDLGIGAHLVDEFSAYVADYLDGIDVNSTKAMHGPTIQDLIDELKTKRLSSSVHVDARKLGRPLDSVSVLEVFGQPYH
jgi:phosphatidylinositol glycan class K